MGKQIKRGDYYYSTGEVLVDDNRNLIITEITSLIDKSGIKRKKYKYKCLNCGFDCGEHYRKGEFKKEMLVDESNLKKGSGCPCCCHNPQIVVEGINDIPTTDPWMIKYFQGGYNEAKLYTKSSNQKIIPICADCGSKTSKPIPIYKIFEYKRVPCVCGDNFSFGHKYMYNLLKQMKVKFKDNVRFDWCRYLVNKTGEYDFVLSDFNVIIEIDGWFHRNDNKMNNNSKEYSKLIDDEKDKVAKENGYDIIRILYNDKDKEDFKRLILESDIKKYVNIEKVDWDTCCEYAMKNISKMVADYWNNKEDYETTSDLMVEFGLSRKTISNYLKKWTKLGYCNYNSKEEGVKKYIKISSTNKEKRSIPIEVYKNGVLLSTFSSLLEMERSSFNVLGIQLQRTNAIKVLKGERKHHKGFTFKYITKEEYADYLKAQENISQVV